MAMRKYLQYIWLWQQNVCFSIVTETLGQNCDSVNNLRCASPSVTAAMTYIYRLTSQPGQNNMLINTT